jgi:hypothetical protein
MKKIITILFLFSAFKIVAQQSLFNVPSISLTKKNEVFFQEQLNATTDGTSVNFNTAYGLGHNLEVGINLIGVGVDFDKNNPVILTNSSTVGNVPHNPLVMLAALKAFKFSENISLGIGVQGGVNPTKSDISTDDIATFNYANFRFDIPKVHLMLCGGGYYSNIIYMGYRDQVGGICGFEYTVIEHKFLLMGDWVIGKNAASVIVPGFVYHPHHNIALSLGWQIPSPGSTNPQGLVFELTLGNFSSK